MSVFPIKVLYNIVEDFPFSLQAGVTVSSRIFKKAVQRNKIKRLLREGYRLHKLQLQEVLNDQHKSVILFFIYIGKELPAFEEIDNKMKIIFQRLHDNLVQKP